MKFDFSADEMQALLSSLIARRNLLKNIIGGRESPIYDRELQIVESVMEKMFPGSLTTLMRYDDDEDFEDSDDGYDAARDAYLTEEGPAKK